VRRSSGVSTHIPAADANTYPREASQPRPLQHRTIPDATAGSSPTRTRQISRHVLPAQSAPATPTSTPTQEVRTPGFLAGAVFPRLGDVSRPLGPTHSVDPVWSRPAPLRYVGVPAVIGPLAPSRQPRRRRITPNANTSTTTMISTHNHVDMAASLVGAGAVQADATAGHPSKQLGHRQASSRSRIDGRAARRLAGPRHPATGPPIWAGQVGASPTPSRSSHEYRHPVPRNPALLSSPAWP
jgi:hypothetical protein